ncbi:MAG: nucleoside triphosphate pyrophosphohydrolase [bacterium]|nr:nucleoside triphosphate pyrophosphohydrolase [bacterium]
MNHGPLQKLFDMIDTLRGENGCPWDRAQTTENIISDLLGEVYELQWAYENGVPEEILDEMGDVVFVLVFAMQLLREGNSDLTLERFVQQGYDKIYRRHPHVFGDEVAKTREEGLAHWDRMKAEERAARPGSADVFDDIPGSLSPVRMAEKIQKAAARTGFDWEDPSGVIAKLREEIEEVQASLTDRTGKRLVEEVGDLYFSIVNLSRFLKIDGERALAGANAKFVKRYRKMAELIRNDSKKMNEMTLEEMDAYWERAKRAR